MFKWNFRLEEEDYLNDFVKANKEYDERIVANIEILQEVLSVAPVHPNPNPRINLIILTVSLPDLKINRSNDFQKFLQKF